MAPLKRGLSKKATRKKVAPRKAKSITRKKRLNEQLKPVRRKVLERQYETALLQEIQPTFVPKKGMRVRHIVAHNVKGTLINDVVHKNNTEEQWVMVDWDGPIPYRSMFRVKLLEPIKERRKRK